MANAYTSATSATNFTVYNPPSILSFTPTSGPTGTSVIIYGANLTGASSVKFNSVTATYTVNSATQITATVPATATTGPISIVTPGGSVTSASLYTVTPPTSTTVTSFTPTSGPVGTSVTITGANFTGATAVSFNGVAATSFTVNTDAQIVATVAVGTTTGKISVVAPTGTALSAANFSISTTPVVSSFSPTTGGVGTTVVITGNNFGAATAVKFNLTSTASFTINSPTQITVAVPAGATTGKVSVVAGAFTGISSGNFTVVATPTITSFTPTSGYLGTSITVTGANLTGASALLINGVPTAITSNTATTVAGTVPVGANLGANPVTVQVTTPGGTATAASKFTLTSTVTLAVDSVRAIPGLQVVVPVRAVTAITGLIGMQGALSFDVPGGLTYVTVESFALSGLTLSSFGTSNTASGRLTFVWNSASNTAVNIPANSILFNIRFSVGAATPLGTALAVKFANTTTPVELTGSGFVPFSFVTKHGKAQIPVAAALSGTVRTGNGTGVPGVTINVTGPLAPSPLPVTPADGTYALPALVSTGAYVLSCAKNNDVAVANGVTVTDVALVQRHILGSSLLGAAYKVVSADVNVDNSVTMTDVAAMQSLILGNISSFTGGALWRFYSAAGGTANSPWPLTSSRSTASLVTTAAQDFTACKLGDVNDSWNPAIPRPAPGAPAAELRLVTPGGAAGPVVRVLPLVLPHGTDPHALQTTLAWDPAVLRLRNANTVSGEVIGQVDQQAGRLPLLWTEPGTTATTGVRPLGELTFDVIGTSATGTTEVRFTDDRTPTLAADNALAPLALTLTPATLVLGRVLGGLTGEAGLTATLALWPNPARETVQLAGVTGNTVVLFDALGRTVATAAVTDGTATLDVRHLPAGVYTVRAGAVTRRLVVSE